MPKTPRKAPVGRTDQCKEQRDVLSQALSPPSLPLCGRRDRSTIRESAWEVQPELVSTSTFAFSHEKTHSKHMYIYIYIISSHSIATTASPLITVIVASIFRQPKRVRVLALQVNPNGSVCDIFNHLFDLAQIFVFQSQKKAPFRIELNLQISLVYAKIPEFLRNIHHHSPALPLHFPTSGVCSVALKKSVWTLGFF